MNCFLEVAEGTEMTRRKPKVSTKMGLSIGLVVLACIAVAIVVMTRPTAVTFKLVDAVGDGEGSHLDIREIRLVKEGDDLVLTMEACDNIPIRAGRYDMPEYFYYFLFDVNKDNFEDFTVTIKLGPGGLSFYGLDNLSCAHLGPAISITIPSVEIGDLGSFNFRAYSYVCGAWAEGIIDNVPDVGWAEVSLT
jgi:hypothetical protein